MSSSGPAARGSRRRRGEAGPGAPLLPSAAERKRIVEALEAATGEARLDIQGHAVGVTSLDRVYWPAEPTLDRAAVTKRDLLHYLVAAAPRLLPHLRDRPLTLFRWPNGIAGKRVLQKHGEFPLPDFVARTRIFSEAKDRPDQYVLCNNLATLVWLAHMGTLEWHAWHSRVCPGADTAVTSTEFGDSTEGVQGSVVEYPDYLLFDLDPFVYAGTEAAGRHPEPNARAFDMARDVARWLHRLLDDMSLTSYVKTSGKTGLHIVVPIRRTVPYAVLREIARVIGEHLMREHPDAITLEWNVQRRSGKVFVDANMNARGKSMIAPYSPRALPGAPVSMPFAWRVLAGVAPGDYRLPALTTQIGRGVDPWAGVLADKQAIEDQLAAGAARS